MKTSSREVNNVQQGLEFKLNEDCSISLSSEIEFDSNFSLPVNSNTTGSNENDDNGIISPSSKRIKVFKKGKLQSRLNKIT